MEPDSLKNQNQSIDEDLSYLASFPERNPNPIGEVDLGGRIYYLNPAARELFPDLPDLGLGHPWLAGLKELVLGSAGRPFPTREVPVRGRWYLQSICYVAELNRLRLYGTDITERKRAEEQVKASENRFRQLAESLPQMVWTCLPDGPCDYLSKKWIDYTGVPAARQLGYGWLDLVHPEDQAGLMQVWKEAVATGSDFKVEFRLRRYDGSYRWFDTRALPFYGFSGQVEKWVGSNTDVQEAREMREALAASENRFRDLFQEMTEGFAWHEVIVDDQDQPCDYLFLEINPAFERLTGLRRGEVIGRRLSQILPGEDPGWIERFGRVALNGKPDHFEKYSSALDRYYEVYAYRPAPLQFAVLFMDISERKRIEKALQESEARYRGHFDNIQEMVAVYQVVRDKRGLIADRVLKDGNPAFLRTAGVDSLEQIRGQTVGQIFGQAYADRNLPVIREVMASGRVQVFESHRETNGRDYITTIQRLDPDHYLATGRDITELKRVEEALRESRDDLNRAQAVAHTGSWRMDIRRNELLWSEENHRIFGIPQGTPLTYETFLGTVHPDDRSAVDRQWQTALDGKPYDIEHRIVVDGRIKWVRERAELEFDPGGVLLGGFGTTQDITELKAAEEAIKAARDELELRVQERTAELKKANEHLALQSRILESFFRDTITPLVLMDRVFNFLRVNEAYARACQRAVADFPGHNHFEFFPHEENEAIFRQVVETGSPYQALAKPFSFPDHPEWGVTYWDWILTPLADDRGETAFLVFSLEEVTDRQVAEEALRKSERQLRTLADQLLYAQENERKRIARDMHDSLGASLSALKYKLEDLVHTLPEREPRQIEEILGSLIPIIQETIGETRRMQNDLRPPLLDDLGILPTLTWFARQFQTVYSRIVIEQRLEVREEDVPERLKVVVFRITQEALNNIGKHARATQIRISLGREQDRLRLVIRDNGMGFDAKRLPESADRLSGMGLSSMKERAELSGGLFTLQTRPEQGTAIEVSWTLPGG